jgi:acylphosphatase
VPAANTDSARVHIWVMGRVQGVGFRAFVQQSGAMFGLTGWVRNVGYDQVEVVAEGRLEWESPSGEFRRFEVRF